MALGKICVNRPKSIWAWNDPYLSVPDNRKVVRENKLQWVIPRSLFIRNGILSDLEVTVWTYELRSDGGDEH